MKKHKIKKYIARVFAITLVLQFAFSSTLTVHAHDAVYLKMTIDDKTMTYNSELITDKHFWATESDHMERKTGNFGNLKTKEASGNLDIINNLFLDIESLEKMKIDELPSVESVGEGIVRKANSDTTSNYSTYTSDDTMIFTFPAKSEGFFGGVNNATSVDVDRAYEISNTLTTSLNNVLRIISEGTRFDTVEDLINTSIYMRPSKQVTTENGTYYEAIVPNKFGRYFHIVYGTDYKYSKAKDNAIKQNYNNFIKNNKRTIINKNSLFDYFPQVDENGRLYAYIWETTENPSQDVPVDKIRSFVWAMPKGYIAIDGINGGQAIIKNNYNFAKGYKEDTAFITIHQLAFQANYSYKNLGMTTANAVFEQQLDAVSSLILNLLSSIFHGLRSLLGLYETQELIFNQGLRGSNLFAGGIMDRNWWGVVLRYHLIFQVFSWVLISGAVVKMLIQMNLSTINPNVRISTMEFFQKLLIVGFLLVSIIPLAQLLVSINTSIVDIFATQVDWSDSTRISSHTNLIAGLLIEFVYFIISLYLNFIYIMRSIMIAILIASGPFFVVSMAFSVRGKGFFDGWSKELIANIFLQSFHAFAFSFMINIQSGARGVEQLVTAMALIPLTEFFRGMIFGQSGSFAISQGRYLATQSVAVSTKASEAFAQMKKNKQNKASETADTREAEAISNDSNINSNSEKLQEKFMKVQPAMAAGLSTFKLATGVALGDNAMIRDASHDFKHLAERSIESAKNFFNSEPIPSSAILAYKDNNPAKPIVSRELLLKTRGIEPVLQNNGGITMVVKDRSKLRESDRAILEQHEQAFKDSSVDINAYKKQNYINNVLMDKNGNITSIGYNKEGMKKLGINDKETKIADYLGHKAYYFSRTNANLTDTYFLPVKQTEDKTDKAKKQRETAI